MNDLNFIHAYFTEEKIESFFFIILGSIGIIVAFIFLFIIQYSFFNGFAIPLLLIGCVQVLVGTIVVYRVPKDISRVEQYFRSEPQKIKTEELPRMEKVQKNFEIYKWVEILLIITGFVLFFIFYNSPQTFWKGVGLGLLIQAAVMLSLDLVAKKRADTYMNTLLTSISKKY